MTDLKEGSKEWPAISREERTQHEIFFFSQGPLEGYLDETKARDLFLKSTLPLPTLSQIWNLADVSNDNLLDVHEFVLAMHLVHGVLQNKKLPKSLPRALSVPKTKTEKIVMSPREKEAYSNLFNALDDSKKGFIEGVLARDLFLLSGLPAKRLALVWDIADVNRDGRLDPDEFNIACHLIRMMKKGEYKFGPVNVFSCLGHRLSDSCLQIRKTRVAEYEERKHKLMSLKEKRKAQVTREKKRLELNQQKVKLVKDLYKKAVNPSLSPEEFQARLNEEKSEIEKQEEIAYRLQKEHEKVRQETVKTILEEQKLSDDIRFIKKETDKLNKRLRAIHTKATKEPDPFHQLYEQRKENAKLLEDLVSSDIFIPFIFNPFDQSALLIRETSGCVLFPECDLFERNHGKTATIPDAVIVSVKDFGDTFIESFCKSKATSSAMSEEEDPIFTTAPVRPVEEDPLLCLSWSGHSEDNSFSDLERKLIDLKNEMTKLNMEGDRLVFKNPEDYSARKRSKEEELRTERVRHSRRKAELSEGVKRRSYHIKTDDEATRAAREYRQNRRSLHLEHGSSPKSELKTDTKTDHKSSSKSELKSDTKTDHKSSSKSELKSDTKTDHKSSSKSELKSDTKTDHKSSSKSDHQTDIKADHKSDTKSDHKSSSKADHKSVTKQESSPEKLSPPERPSRFLRTSSEKTSDKVYKRSPLAEKKTSEGKSLKGQSTKTSSLSESLSESLSDILLNNQKSSEPAASSPECTSPRYASLKKTRAPAPPVSPKAVLSDEELSSEQVSNKSISSNSPPPVSPKLHNEQLHSEFTPDQSSTAVKNVKVGQNSVEISLKTEPNQASKDLPKPPPRLKKRRESSEKTSPRDSVSSPVSPVSPVSLKASSTNSKPTSSTRRASLERKRSLEKDNPTNFVETSDSKNSSKDSGILSSSLESEVFAALRASPLFNDTDSFKEQTCVNTETVSSESEQQSLVQKSDSDFKNSPNSEKPINNNKGEIQLLVKESKPSEKTESSTDRVKSYQQSDKQLEEIPTTNISPTEDISPVKIVKQPKDVKIELVKRKSKETKLLKQKHVIESDFSSADEVVTVIEETVVIKHPIIFPSTQESRDNLRQTELSFFKASQAQFQTQENKGTVIMPEPKLNVPDESTELKVDKQTTVISEVQQPVQQPVKSKSTKKTAAPRPPQSKKEDEKPANTTEIKMDLSEDMVPSVPSISVKEDLKLSSPSKPLVGEAVKLDLLAELNPQPDNISVASIESGNSEPPPLPSSAPPPLLKPVGQIAADENREDCGDEQSSKITTKSTGDIQSDSMMESQNKTVAEMRADFFGLDKLSSGISKVGDEKKESSSDVGFGEIKSSVKESPDDQISLPSEDESSFSATFSPNERFSGDSGVIVSSLPTSPDNQAEGIHLVSYNSLKEAKGENSDNSSCKQTLHDKKSDLSLNLYDSNSKADTVDNEPRSTKAEFVASNSSSPRSPSDGMTSPKGKIYDSEELLGKARQFADIVQKPNFVVKREASSPDDFNQERLQELEMERRAVISQATMRKRDVPILTPSHWHETPEVDCNSADENVTSEVSPSTHHWELIEDPKKPPDVSFQAVDKIALYSKNVIQEKNTTPEVNRESIANLESTRKQWETILTPVTEKEQSPVKTTKSGSVRHWEVKLPSKSPPPKPAPVVTEQSNGISDMADTENESAIEREIRLALEREEMIKKEQMEREQILKPKGKVDIGIFQSNEDDENFKPNYHEMTEADRGSELRKRESMIQEELREQEERERAVSREVVEEVAEEQNSIEEPENPRESIIEKEIRLQREREEEIARIRQLKISANNSKDAPKEKEEVFDEADGEVQNDINHNESKDISYESAIQGYQHEGESRIAKELRELREREEELQRQRQMLSKGNAVTPASASQSSVAPKKEADVPKPETEKKHIPVPSVKTGTWQRDVSPFVQHKNRRESEHSLDSSHSTLKSESDSGMKSESPPNSFNIEISEETPIEREIRLARERENEFRRSKGLPELPLPKSPPKEPESPSTGTVQTFPRHNVAAPSAMRRFASSRLQHEIIAQKQRELDLRKEGKIITTSEEHIEPLKYVSVIGENKTSGSVKRNFVTRRSATASSSDRTEDETASDTSSNASQTAGTHTPDPVAPARRSVIAGSGSTTFSYRESHQTAESKIERELREMREREDELRKLHCRPNPAENESPKETSENGEAESERLTPKRVNLAAQWEQMCNK